MGRHEGPPLGSAAREATASPYHGKRRAEPPNFDPRRDVDLLQVYRDWHDVPDDPPRCGSCGHHLAGECGCTCCTWDEHQERPADV